MPMPSVLTKEEGLLCTSAAFPAGYFSARPFLERITGGFWLASVGWAAVSLLVFVAAVGLWGALLSLGYERSRLPTKQKQILVLLLSSAVPITGFVFAQCLFHGLGELPAARLLSAVGIMIGGAWR